MKINLVICIIFASNLLFGQSQNKPDKQQEKTVTKETLDLIIENQDLQRKNLEGKIESNKELIEERRRDFEDTRALIDSVQNLVYWLFGILLTLILTYVGVDFFNRNVKMRDLDERLKEVEKSVIKPEDV